MGVVLALAAAAAYGAADFLGGIASKRHHVFAVVVTSQLWGALLLAVALPFALGGGPTAGALVWGAAAGAAGGAGVTLLYRGLAIGRMSVVAPITGVVAAVLPVLFGLFIGERPTTLALIGVLVALVAVVLVSSAPEHGEVAAARRAGLPEAFGAGVAFGAFFILLSRAGADTGLWPLVGTRIGSLVLVTTIALASRRPLRPGPGDARVIAGSGVLDVAANLLYLAASRAGLLSLVAVITSMYPAGTILLARVVLGERLHPRQLVGLAAAVAGITLIATG